MEQKDKDLLLQDLCARLPYGVKIHIGKTQRIEIFDDINLRIGSINNTYADIKPYLFPFTSMTEEQKAELSMLVVGVGDIFKSFLIEVEFYHQNHIDYRGLIEKSLALDATNLGIYE